MSHPDERAGGTPDHLAPKQPTKLPNPVTEPDDPQSRDRMQLVLSKKYGFPVNYTEKWRVVKELPLDLCFIKKVGTDEHGDYALTATSKGWVRLGIQSVHDLTEEATMGQVIKYLLQDEKRVTFAESPVATVILVDNKEFAAWKASQLDQKHAESYVKQVREALGVKHTQPFVSADQCQVCKAFEATARTPDGLDACLTCMAAQCTRWQQSATAGWLKIQKLTAFLTGTGTL